MADQREVFTILENDTTAAGVKLPARSIGDAAAGNHAPVIFAIDSSGNYQQIELRDAGEASSGVNSLPILAVKDLSGNFQYINARDEGDAISGVDALPAMIAKDASGNFKYIETRDEGDAASGVDAQPCLIAKDPSGNLIYPQTNSDGELIVSTESAGTAKHAQAQLTADGTMQKVAEITLTASKVYEKIEFMGSNTFTTAWEVVGIEDEGVTDVETVVAEFLTGPGQFTFADHLDWATYTAGTTGTLKLVIRGQQLHGANSELRASIGALEKA